MRSRKSFPPGIDRHTIEANPRTSLMSRDVIGAHGGLDLALRQA
jgi:hypothetical protein